jgi:hypothetical protein
MCFGFLKCNWRLLASLARHTVLLSNVILQNVNEQTSARLCVRGEILESWCRLAVILLPFCCVATHCVCSV